jgi:hypothetical protein
MVYSPSQNEKDAHQMRLVFLQAFFGGRLCPELIKVII